MGVTLIKAECTDQVLRLTENPSVASGGVNEDVIEFSFCPLWDGFVKTAVFYRSEREVYHVQIADNKCTVPMEVLLNPGYFYIGVFGTKDGVTRTSSILSYRVEAGSITEGVKPPEPTPSIYEQILATAQAAKQIAQSLRDDADAGKFKGEKGEPGERGANGTDAPQIDDNAVSANTPWSSQRIVNTLCQKVTASGNPVACTPIKDSSLGIKVSWEPTQATEGKNLFNINGNLVKGSCTYSVTGDTITVSGFPTGDGFAFAAWVDVEANADYVVSMNETSIGLVYVYTDKLFGSSLGYGGRGTNYRFNSGANTRLLIGFYSLAKDRIGTSETISDIQIEKGTTPTPYVPYNSIRQITGRNQVALTVNGEAHTLTLPHVVYGGSVDAATGDVTEEYVLFKATSARLYTTNTPSTASNWVSAYYTWDAIAGKNAQEIKFCNALPVEKWDFITMKESLNNPCCWYATSSWGIAVPRTQLSLAGDASTQEILNAIQSYADELGFEIAYELATPTHYQITGIGEVTALAGTNTLSTDADQVTVTWREAVRADVKDVRVNGESVLANGVANVPVASIYRPGVVRIGSGFGCLTTGDIFIPSTPAGLINDRTPNNAITADVLDRVVKAAMCDGKGAAWTSAEQAAARERMGIDKPYELIETVVVTEDISRFERTAEPNGTPYSFTAMRIHFGANFTGVSNVKCGIYALVYLGSSGNAEYIYQCLPVSPNDTRSNMVNSVTWAELVHGHWLSLAKQNDEGGPTGNGSWLSTVSITNPSARLALSGATLPRISKVTVVPYTGDKVIQAGVTINIYGVRA